MDRRTFAALAAGSALLTVAGALLPKAALAQSLRLTGAGASFPFPLYSTWFQAYSQATSGIEIDYQSTGSGAGVKSFISRTVDFAASDSAMTDEQIDQVDGGVVILPMTAGEIVLAYNLPDVTELKLPREVYPLIFLGGGFAKLTNTPAALLQNAGGNYVAPGGEGGPLALAGAEFKGDDLRGWVTDPAAPEAYPITTFTWMLFYKKQETVRAEALRNLVTWALADGQKMAEQLGYIPLPEAVVSKVSAQIPNIGSTSA